MSTNKTASEMMESPDVCPFCEADAMDVDVDNDGEGYCCKCHRAWKLERRLVGYSFTDKEGEYHEVTEEPGDRIATLEERVRILREALVGITRWVSEDDYHPKLVMGDFLKDLASARAALEATKEGA